MRQLAGFHAALPTPFSEDGSRIAEDVIGQLVERNFGSGLDGLYVGGSTGECYLLSDEERLRLFALVAEAANGKGTLIAQVGDLNPDVSNRLAQEAARLGFDAVSAVPPFYFPYRFPEIHAHYARLAAATDLPFLVYNFPALTSVRLAAEDLVELLNLPNVVGVKNTCGDTYAFERLRRLAPEATLLAGYDESLLPGLSLGADGGIGSTYNVQASRVLALGKALASGDLTKAQHIQSDMNRLIDVFVRHGVFPSLKHLLTCLGLPMGPCRAPFQPLGQDAKRDVEALAAGLTEAASGANT